MRSICTFWLLCTVLTLSGQAIRKSTHIYAEKDGETLALDLYQAAGADTILRPVLIWMHGGGFSGGQRDHPAEVRLMETMARAGYVAASISYRLLRKGEPTGFGCDCPRSDKLAVFREAAFDAWDAIHYLYTRREALGIDPGKIIVGGSSAGAEAILNAVYLKDWLFETETPYDSIAVAAIWSQAGAVVDARYIGARNATPGVFFHGTADNLVPYATAPHHYCTPEKAGYIWLDGARSITRKLQEWNTSYLFYTYPDAGHEIAGIQFDRIPEVLDFFDKIFAGKTVVQKEVVFRP